jgi:hypothetical protein
MAAQILSGFDRFAGLLARWLTEAQEKKLLRPEANPRELADFLVTALNGAAALFSARQDLGELELTIRQLRSPIDVWRT